MTTIRIGRVMTWWNGWRDRRAGLPAPDRQTLMDFERRIISAANATIRRTQLASIKETFPRLGDLAIQHRHVDLHEGPARDHTVAAANGRVQDDVVIGRGSHAAILGALTAGEMILNAQAFAMYGESLAMTWLMALALGLGLPAVAYVLGLELRQARWTRRRIASWTIVALAVLTTLGGVNYVREAYLATVQDQVSTDPRIGFAYLAINLFIFVAAMLVSFYAHDPVPGFEDARQRLERRQAAIARLRGDINQRLERFRANQAQVKESALALISHYRDVVRRRRPAVPAYFDSPQHDDCVPVHRFVVVDQEEAR